jgi:hypothetical protein
MIILEHILDASGASDALDALDQFFAKQKHAESLIDRLGLGLCTKKLANPVQFGLVDIYILAANLRLDATRPGRSSGCVCHAASGWYLYDDQYTSVSTFREAWSRWATPRLRPPF